MTRLKGLLTLCVAAMIAMIGITAAPASAADRDTLCDYGELCMWWGTSYSGSRVDILLNNSGTHPTCFDTFADCSHYNDFFLTGTTAQGRGQRVLNNASSALNKYDVPVRIYAEKLCVGGVYYQLAGQHSTPNLGSVRNNNESHCWVY